MTDDKLAPISFRYDDDGNIIVDSIDRTCRNCHNFVRVHENGGFDLVRRRGFCILTREYGIGLYTGGTPCDAHVYSPYNAETEAMENRILKKKHELCDKAQYDARTKEYKMMKSFCEDMLKTSSTEEIIKACRDFMAIQGKEYKDQYLKTNLKYSIMGSQVVDRAVETYLCTLMYEQFKWLYNRRHMSLRNYNRIITWIQLNLAKEAEKLESGIYLEEVKE